MTDTPKIVQNRSISSEGETPRPDSKSTKMATNEQKVSDDLKSQIVAIAKSVEVIKDGQDGLKRTLESKIDRLRNDVLSTIDEKMKALKTDIDLDIGVNSRRIDELVSSVHLLTQRIDQFEQNPIQGDNVFNGRDTATNWTRGTFVNPLDNNDITVIVKDLPTTPGEDLLMKARELISALGEDVSSNARVVAASRLQSRFQNKPGLVKISLADVEQKILVVRNKFKLKNHRVFKRVFIQSAKSNVERLLELNARTLLRELPQGRSYRVSANGRILHRQGNEAAQMWLLETVIWKQSSRIPIRVFPGPMRILPYVT